MTVETENKLQIVRFSEIVGVKYPIFIIMIELVIKIIVTIFDYVIIIIYSNLDKKYFYEQLMWIIIPFFSNLLALYFLIYIYNKIIKLVNRFSNFIDDDEIFNIINKFFYGKRQNIILLFLFIPIIFQINFLILNPWEWWQVKYNVDYNLTLINAIMAVIGTCTWVYIILNYLYICIISSYIIYKIGLKLYHIDVNKIELVDWKGIGNMTFIISITWIFTLALMLTLFLISPVEWWSIGQLIIYIVTSLGFFIVPMYSTRNSLRHLKKKSSFEIKEKIWKHYIMISDKKDFQIPNDDSVAAILSYDLLEKRISKISSWPIDFSRILQFIGVFLGPIISFILQHY